MQKKRENRRNVIKEMLTTEENYVDQQSRRAAQPNERGQRQWSSKEN